jgi:hypothetical protein
MTRRSWSVGRRPPWIIVPEAAGYGAGEEATVLGAAASVPRPSQTFPKLRPRLPRLGSWRRRRRIKMQAGHFTAGDLLVSWMSTVNIIMYTY